MSAIVAMGNGKECRRVVITGMGLVTPLATGVEASWRALCEGKSGVGPITRFDASSFRTQIAAEVKDFQAADFLTRKQVRIKDLYVQYSLAAAQMAMDDAGLALNSDNACRAGVLVGNCLGGINTLAAEMDVMKSEGPLRISPYLIPNILPNMASGDIAQRFGAKGPNRCVSTACASGNHSLGDAFRLIQHGEADAMIAGGVEAGIVPIIIAGVDNLGACSRRNSDPEGAMRPFERDRDGFVTGEGSGVLVLEELESALRRGAKNIYAEVAGYGSTDDAYHWTSPQPSAESSARCIRLALEDAGLSPPDIGLVNAHGTSTVLNDVAETRAIKLAFGEHSGKLPVSANKSMIGHCFGAAGAIEAVFTVLSIRTGTIPPTINYQNPDPECDLDYVPNRARKAEIKAAISNSFGFGGTNAVVAFKAFQ